MGTQNSDLSLIDQQREIQNRCYHPLGGFVPFERDDINLSISARFEKQVRKYPDRLAIKADDREMTYAQLNQTANCIARVVVEKYGSNDLPIVLLIEHGITMICGIMGVLKAGKTYVPLDPLFPRARNAHIMSDSQAGLLVTNTRNLKYAAELNERHLPLINIDEIGVDPSAGNLELEIPPDQTAYILYTSGSTGLPKGVFQSHRNLLHNIMQYTNTLHLCHNDRMTLLYSFNVNGHLRGLFGSLLNGAALFPFDVKAKGLTDVADWLNREEITFFHSVPTVFRHFIDTLHGDEQFPHVRLIRFGGERVPADNVDFYKQHFPPHCILYTGMGSTETSTVRQYFTDKNTELAESVVPTGFAVDEREVILLDDNRQEVPVNEVGQIAVKSRYLALGYWGKPEETAKKFVPAPDDDQARLYLTGDLGRILPDGRLIHMGRSDAQVKVRGHRVETAEVEAVLLKHPSVKEAAVVAWPDGHGDNFLAAYTVFHADDTKSASDLRHHLRESLPDYMIPASFMVLDAMPLTPNSKINKRALPRPEKVRPELETKFVAPGTPVEKTLAEIWTAILGIGEIGVLDNFFELGGHSLAATRVMSRIRDAFGINLPLRVIFEMPTIVHIAELISQNQADVLRAAPIERVSRDRGGVPLSFAQQRLWFLDKLEPGSSAYHIVTVHQLAGILNVAALEKSFNEVVRRHEALRTSITMDGDQPVQSVAPEMQIPLRVIDISKMPALEQEAETQRLIKEIQLQPFDLSKSPLLRVALLQLTSTVHTLVVVMHHIISDAWSMNIFFAELSKCYEAFSEGRTPSLPELPIQYGDFADWQRNWLQGEVLDEQISYWKQQLGNSPSVLTLPEDFPRPPVQTFRGGQHSVILPFETSKALVALSRQENVTLFAVLLSAFKVLLYRHTKQEGVVLGIPIASRNRKEIENLIGFFISTLVLYTPISPGSTFKELLTQEREILLGAYEHQEVPFEKLVEELHPERDLSHTPLFQIFFNMTTEELHKLDLRDLQVELTMPAERESKFDMTLYVNETGGDIRFKLVYNADLFRHERMVEFITQYQGLLTQIAENPERLLDEYSLVSSQVRACLPDPTIPIPSEWFGAVHTMFSEQVERVPTHIALRDKFQTWQYQDLETHSNQIAHYLLENGIHSEDKVAIYGHRDGSLVAALLAVLKAGAAFIILDPTYPAARLIDYCQIAKPKGWLQLESAGQLSETLAAFVDETSWDCRVTIPIGVKSGGNILNKYPVTAPKGDVEPDDLAYVAFTSGTTGRPRAIQGTHCPLSHFIQWHRTHFGFEENDHFSMLSGLAHDPLLRDIFTPLTTGATLCIPDLNELSSRGLVEWFIDNQVSVAHLTPAMSKFLTADMGDFAGAMNSVRYLFFGGESLTRTQRVKIQKLIPTASCVNYYGATETPQAMAYFLVPENDSAKAWEVTPLGQGIDGVHILVLNSAGHLTGAGELGEIYIRTPYLSRGYLGDEKLTHERFIANPFTQDEADRLYRTGDLGYYLLDGNVQFAGRADGQVKIRGFRIELGEIEAALSRHPHVKQAVVMVRENGDERHLVAYVIPGTDQSIVIDELRGALKDKLPNYMVPSAFVILESLPLTPNGKVDYQKLPNPDWTEQTNMGYVTPRDELEFKLAQIWENVLNVRPIGIRDNFFDIGGHSLLAVQLFAQINRVLGHDLPLATLFQASTIEQMSKLIREGGWQTTWSSLVPLQPEGSRPPLFCVHAVGGNVLSLRDLASHLGMDQPFYALQSQGLDGKRIPPTTIEEMAHYYIEELQTVQPKGPYFLAGQSSGGVIAFEMAQQLQAQGHAVIFLALIDTYEPGRKKTLEITRADRLAFHRQNLIQSGLPYLINQMQARGRRVQRKITEKLSKLIISLYQMIGKPIPYHFRHIVVRGVIQRATRNYEPKPYSSQMILYRALNTVRAFVEDRYDIPRAWMSLAEGGLEIHDIAGAHNLEQEPFVGVLADHLGSDLKKVQESIGQI